MLIVALSASTLVMSVLWIIHLRIKNAGLVDIGWAGNFSLIATIYLFMGSGAALRKGLIALMAIFWSARLAFYLFQRTIGQDEEGRYQRLRQEWGGNLNLKFFFFFLFQGLLNVLLSMPFLFASMNSESRLSILEFLGVIIWLVAFTGESVADRQLQKFKANPENNGKVCQVGLWKYSRHPNYFFEWLIWVAFFVFALASPNGYFAVVCPIIMFYFLWKVTGIKATEEQAIRSKGEAYRQYQRTTSPFVPWFPKKA